MNRPTADPIDPGELRSERKPFPSEEAFSLRLPLSVEGCISGFSLSVNAFMYCCSDLLDEDHALF